MVSIIIGILIPAMIVDPMKRSRLAPKIGNVNGEAKKKQFGAG